jgi:hypothetical protein
LEAAGEGVAAGGGLADAGVALEGIAEEAAAAAAFGLEAFVEGVDEGAQGGFAGVGEDFAEEFGGLAAGETGASIAGGEGIGHVAQQGEEQGFGGFHAGGAGGRAGGGDVGHGQEALGEARRSRRAFSVRSSWVSEYSLKKSR